MRLSELKQGERCEVVKVLGHGAFRKRVIEMGFVRGRVVEAVLAAPLRDPVKYRLMGYEVSLRRSEARLIEVEPLAEGEVENIGPGDTTVETEHRSPARVERLSHTINVALIGNPNCGKTSLFNIASGANEHVGNYSGVTVEQKTGKFEFGGYHFNIVDLPGTYSLTAYSPEELYVRRYLADQNPDVIINVVDASNLERNLYLTTELIDMDHPMVIALNMYDELRRDGTKLDYKTLGKMIGVPIVPTAARSGEGIPELFKEVIDVYERRNQTVRHVHVKLGADIEEALSSVKDLIKADKTIEQNFSPRYLAIKLLEGDREAEHIVEKAATGKQILAERDAQLRLLRQCDPSDDISGRVASEKYGFIAGALAETMQRKENSTVNLTRVVDAIVTSKVLGFPIFIAVMLFVFWMTFAVGAYPADWMQAGVDWLSAVVENHFPAGPLKDMIAQGVIGGVGGVIVFLPNILILFFFISFMEDTGYMGRAAFIMDRLMHKIGLHGKSFIPLLMGFGCNVPAIMACRAIESRSSRLITMLINPFMSCSARLPLYVLLVGTFFSAHAAFVIMLLYVVGVAVAVATARLLRRFVFKVDETPFVMELPPYRLPTLKTSLRHMWWKARQYLKKMGGIILVASVIVWALNYFPLHNDTLVEEATPSDTSAIDPAHDSYLQMLGKAVSPVMEPLGLGWKPTVAAIAGVPAKEIVVSTMGVLYTGSEEATDTALSTRLTTIQPGHSAPDFNSANALAFMVFILLYCPCVATVTAIVKESGSWRYGLFTILYNTAVAWVVAFITYRIALLF